MTDNDLSDDKALAAITKVVDSWVKANGIESLDLVEHALEQVQKRSLHWPAGFFPEEESGKATAESAKWARWALGELKDRAGKEGDWARNSIAEVSKSEAQVVEWIIVGRVALLGAIILISRIKKIDKSGVEFTDNKAGDIAAIVGLLGTLFSPV